MSSGVPSVLILGHSFVKRLKHDLRSHFDPWADDNFKLGGNVSVHLHGVGGCTVAKLRSFNLHVVEQIAPDVLILEIGTNDFVDTSLEVVGSEIESLVCLLVEDYKVRVVCVCYVIQKDFYLPDGGHVNPAGQYHLYRSYRGAIFRALRLL